MRLKGAVNVAGFGNLLLYLDRIARALEAIAHELKETNAARWRA